MNLAHRQGRMLTIVIGALTAGAVIVAMVRGSWQIAILVVLVVVLLAAHVVRHQVRARMVYKRQMVAPGASHPAAAGQPGPVADSPERTDPVRRGPSRSSPVGRGQ